MSIADLSASDDPDAPGAIAELERVWSALLTAARWARQNYPLEDGSAYGLDSSCALTPVAADSRDALMTWQQSEGWRPAAQAPTVVAALLDLYLPLCGASAAAPLRVGHLGQGLDGYIATSSGDSNYVTGPENIAHLHRMRALSDAVIVGAGTVASDDPRLTTRLVRGDNPVRVILDPQRRLPLTQRIFRDAAAPTLIVCDESCAGRPPDGSGIFEIVGIPSRSDGLDLEYLLRELHARKLYMIFVEGGGSTVSRFLEAGLLDRLQIAIAPLVTGAGKPGLRLAARQRISECLRPDHRVFRMGADVLFDCDLRAGARASDATPAAAASLSRII